MPSNSNDVISNSLKDRIWLAVGALAILNCIIGLLAYLAASFFTSNTFFIVFTTFVMTSVCTVSFGSWMSAEILRPIEKVNLLAKSLERGSSVSLPKTTGSSETDELLQTLHRSSRQLQNLIAMMDGVSSGNTETALTPIENSDRLSASFQRLVARVTGSVDAGKELDELQTAVDQLASDLSTVKNGDLNFEIREGVASTRSIADAVRTLVSRQNELVGQVKANSADANRSALAAKELIRTAIENDDARSRKIKRAAESFRNGTNQFEQVSAEVLAALADVNRSTDDFETGKQSALHSFDAIRDIRKEIAAASQKLQRVADQSTAIAQVSKIADDLARRSNLIALNTSIRGGSEAGGTVSLIAGEIASLSERAGHINKEVSVINESVAREVEEAQAALRSVTAGIMDISVMTAKSDESITHLGAFFDGLVHLPAKVESGKSRSLTDTRQLLSILDECSVDAAASETRLKECEQMISKLAVPLENLQESVSDLRFAPELEMESAIVLDYSADPDFGTLTEDVQDAELFELVGEN